MSTQDYTFSIEDASNIHLNITNSSTTNPLTIKAELIELKPLINAINNTDSIFYKVEKDIAKQALKVNLEVINDTKKVRTEIIHKIISELELTSKKTESHLLELTVVDSLKVYNHFAKKSNTNQSKIYTSKDSISIENISLQKFAEIINKQYDVETFSDNTTLFIDFNFKSNNFNAAKKYIFKTLGLKFITSNKNKTTYLISKKK